MAASSLRSRPAGTGGWGKPRSLASSESGDRSGFALILYSKRLQALAEAVIVEAVRLDAQEAPQREVELQQTKEEESRVLLKRARSVNKLNFRP
jgi:hypothetical protein